MHDLVLTAIFCRIHKRIRFLQHIIDSIGYQIKNRKTDFFSRYLINKSYNGEECCARQYAKCLGQLFNVFGRSHASHSPQHELLGQQNAKTPKQRLVL